MQRIDERVHSYEPFFGKWYLNDPPEVLGRGSSGVVYLVHADGVDAALKLISIPRDQAQYDAMMQECDGSLERVRTRIDRELDYARTEIAIMERLKSDSHIVCFESSQIFERTDTYGYDVLIRMERLERLDTVLSAPDKYGFTKGPKLTLRIWSELVSGLRLCERCNIVHLDIKPENIFYDASSKDYFKLGDFGVSIRSENGRSVGAGMIVGTMDYIAPEVYEGNGGDIRSDMYSLAVVMYWMFNGERLPFMTGISRPKEEDFKLARAKRLEQRKEIPPIKGLDPGISAILMRCLKWNPNDRYPSMAALYDDLEKYRLKRRTNWKKVALILGGLTVAGALAAGGAYFFLNSTRKPSAEFEKRFTVKGENNLISPAKQDILYVGQAKNIPSVSVLLNSQLVQEAPVNADGGVEIVLDRQMLVQGAPNQLSFEYDGRQLFADTLCYDDSVALLMDVSDGAKLRVNEDVTGKTDAGAAVSLLNENGDVVASVTAEESGAFNINLEGDRTEAEAAVTPGAYRLVVEDEAGNSQERVLNYTDSVEAQTREQARLSVATIDTDALAELRDGVLWVRGNQQSHAIHITGDSGANVNIRLGEQTQTATIGDMGFINMDLTFEEGESQLEVAYEASEQPAFVCDVMADYTVPSVEIVGDVPKAMSESALTVRVSEANVLVQLRDASGGVQAERMAEQAGEVELGPVSFQFDDYTVVARDEAGNEGSCALRPELTVAVSDVDSASEAFTVETIPGSRVTARLGEHEWTGEAASNGIFSRSFDDVPLNTGDELNVTVELDGHVSETIIVKVGQMRLDEPIQLKEIVGSNFSGGGVFGGDLRLSGTAKRRAGLTVLWNGVECAQTTVGDEGEFEVYIPAAQVNLPVQGESGTLRVRYTDGGEDAPMVEQELQWDGATELTVYDLKESSEALSGSAEPGALVEVFSDGEKIGETQASGDGTFNWRPDEGGFARGVTFLVRATDSANNSAEGEVKVQVVNRRLIEARVVVKGDLLTINGTAHPGMEIEMRWNNHDPEKTVVGEDGSFAFELNARQYGLDMAGEEGQITIAYSDGFGEGKDWASGTFVWDAGTFVNLWPVNEDSQMLEMEGEPGATVTIYLNGGEEPVAAKERIADDGMFSWRPDEGTFRMGDLYRAVVKDDSGNQAEDEIEVTQTLRGEITDVTVNGMAVDALEGTAFKEDALTVEGVTEPRAEMSVYWNDAINTVVTAESDGSFSATLNGEALDSAGETGSIVVAYADGGGVSRAVTTGAFNWRAKLKFEMDALTEDSDALVIRVDNVSDAVVNIYREDSGEPVVSDAPIENGVYEWNVGLGAFAVGDAFRVVVSDPTGYQEEDSVQVGASPLAEITSVTVNDAPADVPETVREAELVVRGVAEPNADLSVYWSDAIRSDVHIQEDGTFETRLSGELLNATGETGCVTLCYAGGLGASRLVRTGEILWDCKLAFSVDELREDSGELAVCTDPGASVRITGPNGETELSAGEDGWAHYSEPDGQFRLGDVYSISVSDAAGNSQSQEETVLEALRQPIQIQNIDNQDENGLLRTDVLTVRGQAEPGEQLAIIWADREPVYGAVNENGDFEITLSAQDIQLHNDGESAELQVAYADFKGMNSWDSRLLTWDSRVRLEVLDAVTEDTEALNVFSDNGAQITVSTAGNVIGGGVANEEGYALIEIDRTQLIAGAKLTLTSVDAAGNETSNSVDVGETARGKVVALVDNLVMGLLRSTSLSIQGEAEPNSQVRLRVSCPAGIIEKLVDVNENGRFNCAVSAEECGVDRNGSATSAQITYADGVGERSGTRKWTLNEFKWDCEGPELTASADKTQKGQFMLYGETDGMRMSIEKNGEEIETVMNEDGTFESKGFDLALGDAVIVRSWDNVGNVTELSFGGQGAPKEQIGEIWLVDDRAYTPDETVSVKGWYAVKDEAMKVELALYSVEWEKEGEKEVEKITPVGQPVDLASIEELPEDELETHVDYWSKYWEQRTDVMMGYSFTAEVPLKQFKVNKTGQYRLILRWYEKADKTYYVVCKSEPPFIIKVD